MRWPWRRADPPEPVRADRPAPPAPGPMGWAFLPPLQRVLPEPDLVTRPSAFPRELPSWRSPSFSAPPTHLVLESAPGGVIDADGGGVGTPATTARTPVLALLPPPPPSAVQRRSAGPTPGGALTLAPATGLPVIQRRTVEEPSSAPVDADPQPDSERDAAAEVGDPPAPGDDPSAPMDPPAGDTPEPEPGESAHELPVLGPVAGPTVEPIPGTTTPPGSPPAPAPGVPLPLPTRTGGPVVPVQRHAGDPGTHPEPGQRADGGVAGPERPAAGAPTPDGAPVERAAPPPGAPPRPRLGLGEPLAVVPATARVEPAPPAPAPGMPVQRRGVTAQPPDPQPPDPGMPVQRAGSGPLVGPTGDQAATPVDQTPAASDEPARPDPQDAPVGDPTGGAPDSDGDPGGGQTPVLGGTEMPVVPRSARRPSTPAVAPDEATVQRSVQAPTPPAGRSPAPSAVQRSAPAPTPAPAPTASPASAAAVASLSLATAPGDLGTRTGGEAGPVPTQRAAAVEDGASGTAEPAGEGTAPAAPLSSDTGPSGTAPLLPLLPAPTVLPEVGVQRTSEPAPPPGRTGTASLRRTSEGGEPVRLQRAPAAAPLDRAGVAPSPLGAAPADSGPHGLVGPAPASTAAAATAAAVAVQAAPAGSTAPLLAPAAVDRAAPAVDRAAPAVDPADGAASTPVGHPPGVAVMSPSVLQRSGTAAHPAAPPGPALVTPTVARALATPALSPRSAPTTATRFSNTSAAEQSTTPTLPSTSPDPTTTPRSAPTLALAVPAVQRAAGGTSPPDGQHPTPSTGAVPTGMGGPPSPGREAATPGPVTVMRATEVPIGASGPVAVQTAETREVAVGSSENAAETPAVDGPDQVEALAQKLLVPMLRRIRAELLLDRERQGLRTDRW